MHRNESFKTIRYRQPKDNVFLDFATSLSCFSLKVTSFEASGATVRAVVPDRKGKLHRLSWYCGLDFSRRLKATSRIHVAAKIGKSYTCQNWRNAASREWRTSLSRVRESSSTDR